MPFEMPTRSTALTTFTVKVGGAALPETYRIIAIDIAREMGRVPTAQIVLQDGDVAAQTFAASEGADLVPGTEIEILGGYEREETRLFKGIVTRQRIEAPRRGDTRLHVEAKHPAVKMTLGRRSRTWTDSSDLDAMGALAQSHGIALDGEAGPIAGQIVQHQVSDWDFVVQRAEQTGKLVLATDDGLSLVAPPASGAADATLAFGQGVFALDLELDGGGQLAAVEAGAWSPADQGLLTAEADDAPAPGPGNLPGAELGAIGGVTAGLRHPGARDQAALDGWAAAAMLRNRLSAIRGTVQIQGTADAKPGGLVDLQGMGARYNGLAFVAGVRHQLGRGDWTTTVQVGLDPRFHHERFRTAAPGAAGRIPPVSGLQVGVVSALEGDPQGEDRIEVRLAAVSEDEGLVWARIAAFDAGGDRGAVFRPEIGDEVVLGFLDDDPRDPVVLGAMHSSAHAAPIPGSDDNHEKGYVSRSGMKLLFNDELTAVQLETPAGNKLLLSEDEGGIVLEDQSGNSIRMTSDGIELSSARDLKLSATGDLTLEGVNVSFKAQAQATVEGSAGAALKSSGQVEVNGSLVRIN
jgi:Rhs element Vgr protein